MTTVEALSNAANTAPRLPEPGVSTTGAGLPAALARGRLWLALDFPDLPLQSCGPQPASDSSPRAVSVHERGRARLLTIDASARAAGLAPGMSVSGATALCPGLRVWPHDPLGEAAALQGLAAWGASYTSLVCTVPPRGLLMEVGASLRLFGGLGRLLARLREDLQRLHYHARLGVAPTPAAARMLARAGGRRVVTVAHRLASALAPVPVRCMDIPEHAAEELEALGALTFGDCVRLPRDGLAKRLGPALLEFVDRVLGRRPDPREPWSPPEVFERRLDLTDESEDLELIMAALERMLQELAGFLHARASGARALELLFAHRRGPGTRLVLELATPCRDPCWLGLLLAERLQRLKLGGGVVYLGLRVHDLAPLAPRSGDLYKNEGSAGQDDQDLLALVERLQARLGREAVHGLQRRADHRPERMSIEPLDLAPRIGNRQGGAAARSDGRLGRHPVAAGRTTTTGSAASEAAVADPHAVLPLWLLPQPCRLRQRRDGAVLLDGSLELERGPHRIESGWWDGADVARDYYVARAGGGSRYWIFRELREPRRWFLHGIFA